MVEEVKTHNDKPPEDVVKDIYVALIQQGYKLNEIDEMDIGYYFDIMQYVSNNNYKRVYIDEI